MEKVIKTIALRRRMKRPGTRASYRPCLPVGSGSWDESGRSLAI